MRLDAYWGRLRADSAQPGGRKISFDGILLIDKNENETSYGVVKKVKSAVGQLGIKKVGHAGTLDPFATGLLIILLGRGVKLSRFIMQETKIYRATVCLGIETDTLDPTGRVVGTSEVPDLSPKYITDAAQFFVGDIEQVPPAFSAVKYEGTRAYKLARKGHEVKLKKRKVTVHAIRVVSVALPAIAMEITCSKGTYIRTIASDLGKRIGTGGHLASLRRVANGPFRVQNAIRPAEILKDRNHSSWPQRIIPLREALPGMREITVPRSLGEKIRHGYQPAWEEVARYGDLGVFAGGHTKLVEDGKLLAIVNSGSSAVKNHGHKLKIERVFL